MKNINCKYLIYINGNEQVLPSIRTLGFYHPILLDTNSVFIQKNELWDKRFQTALPNERNEVILIGDPTVNEDLKKLYIVKRCVAIANDTVSINASDLLRNFPYKSTVKKNEESEKVKNISKFAKN